MLRAKTLTGPDLLDVRTYTNPDAVPSPLPAGATVSEILLPPASAPEGLTQQKLEKYVKMGKQLQDAGVPMGGVNFDQALAMMVTGFGVGGPWGAVAGFIVYAVQHVLNSANAPQRGWEAAGPGVHAYAATFLPQAFIDWCRANGATASWATVDEIQKAFVVWTVEAWKVPLVTGKRTYSNMDDSAYFGDGDAWAQFNYNIPPESTRQQLRARPPRPIPGFVRDIYATMGIDYEASEAARNAGKSGFMLINRAMRVESPKDDGSGSGDDDNNVLLVGGLALAAGYVLTRNS